MTEYSRDSTFNMGIAHLARIDALLYDVAYASAEDDYVNWHKSLTLLVREVFFLFTEEEMQENARLDNRCVDAINKFKTNKDYESKSAAYNCLVDFELFIKQQLAQRKMLMAFNKDLRVSISDLN
jgi:hypothetical protein